MPFDPTPVTLPAISRNGVELANLRMLADALEREMPEGWTWDFATVHNDCGTAGCALGLAIFLGIIVHNLDAAIATAWGYREKVYFGLDGAEANRIFYEMITYGMGTLSDVTPAMVAAELRRVIAREEAEMGL